MSEAISEISKIDKQPMQLRYWVPSASDSGSITFDYRGYRTVSLVVGTDWGHIYSLDLHALVETAKIAINTYNKTQLVHQIFIPSINPSYPTSYFNVYVTAISDNSITMSYTYITYNGTSHTVTALGTEGWVYAD